jgi:hypothetical protein
VRGAARGVARGARRGGACGAMLGAARRVLRRVHALRSPGTPSGRPPAGPPNWVAGWEFPPWGPTPRAARPRSWRASIGADANWETVGADARGTSEQGGERRRAWRGGSKIIRFVEHRAAGRVADYSRRCRCSCYIMNAAAPHSTSSASRPRHYVSGGYHRVFSVPGMSRWVFVLAHRAQQPQSCAVCMWRPRRHLQMAA